MACHKRPDVQNAGHQALVNRLRRYQALVEVGIGSRHDVATALATSSQVTGVDIEAKSVPDSVRFVQDDITAPTPAIYHGMDALYGLNLPPELHRPALAVARTHDAAFAFTTLGTEQPIVPARPETLPTETLFWARE